jgi:hypothetical protein
MVIDSLLPLHLSGSKKKAEGAINGRRILLRPPTMRLVFLGRWTLILLIESCDQAILKPTHLSSESTDKPRKLSGLPVQTDFRLDVFKNQNFVGFLTSLSNFWQNLSQLVSSPITISLTKAKVQ